MFRTVLISFLSLAAGGLHAAAPKIVEGEQGKSIAAAAERAAADGFTGILLVARGDDVIFQSGFSFADRQAKIPNDAEMVFDSASTTKAITAAAIFVLEQQNKLDVDDPVAKHLSFWPPAYKDVTIYHLLTHTGGLEDTWTARGDDFRSAVETKLALQPLSPPGATYAYSNTGYGVLAGLIEQVSGMRYEDFCRQEVLAPAGMTQSGFCGEQRFDRSRAAMGYVSATDFEGHVPYVDPYTPMDVYGVEAKGFTGLVTTVTDLNRFCSALRGDAILSKSSKKRMFTPCAPQQGCGWEIFQFENGVRCFGRGGQVRGYLSKIWFYPDDDIRIIMAMNQCSSQNPPTVQWTLIRECFQVMLGSERRPMDPPSQPLVGEAPPQDDSEEGGFGEASSDSTELMPAEPASDPTAASELEGNYVFPSGVRVRLTAVDGKLIATVVEAKGEAAASFKAQADLAREIVSGLSTGDISTFEANLSARLKPFAHWPSDVLSTQWPELLLQWGPMKSFKVIGAERVSQSPDGKAPYWTYVWLALEHDKGTDIALLVLNEQRKVEMLVLDLIESLFGTRTDGGSVVSRRTRSDYVLKNGSGEVFIEVDGKKLILHQSSLSFLLTNEE